MLPNERRIGFRVPLEILLTQYIHDRPYRALTSNISDTGVHIETVALARSRMHRATYGFGLSFELPDTGEVIWARGQLCHGATHGPTMAVGIEFTGMARAHQTLLRDFCIETRHTRLDRLLQRINDSPTRP